MRDALLADHGVQEAAKVNDRTNFGFVGDPAFRRELVGGYDQHGTVIEHVYSDREALKFVQKLVLDDVYKQLTEAAQGEAG